MTSSYAIFRVVHARKLLCGSDIHPKGLYECIVYGEKPGNLALRRQEGVLTAVCIEMCKKSK